MNILYREAQCMYPGWRHFHNVVTLVSRVFHRFIEPIVLTTSKLVKRDSAGLVWNGPNVGTRFLSVTRRGSSFLLGQSDRMVIYEIKRLLETNAATNV